LTHLTANFWKSSHVIFCICTEACNPRASASSRLSFSRRGSFSPRSSGIDE
jgi:hypothetical protein